MTTSQNFIQYRNISTILFHKIFILLIQAGDRYDFTGTLIVVPDVGSLSLPGAKAELTTRTKQGSEGQMEGIKGLKALGVRELHYK